MPDPRISKSVDHFNQNVFRLPDLLPVYAPRWRLKPCEGFMELAEQGFMALSLSQYIGTGDLPIDSTVRELIQDVERRFELKSSECLLARDLGLKAYDVPEVGATLFVLTVVGSVMRPTECPGYELTEFGKLKIGDEFRLVMGTTVYVKDTHESGYDGISHICVASPWMMVGRKIALEPDSDR